MLKRTLDFATNSGFLKKTVLPKYNIDQFKIGPLGLLLCQNINTEWLYHTLINKELTVCPNEGDIDNTYDFVKILCSNKLPFGITDVKRQKKSFTTDEIVEYYKNATKGERFKERKFVTAHTITSQINLPTIFLNAICDAYQEPVFQDNVRPMFHFHRKLAPFKLSFAMTGSSQAITKELEDLALYLCKQLRANHVSTLYLPSSSRNTLEAQYKQYDQLGIPYTVVLNERTLNDGIANLRSRDTTLKEQVHVTELVTYVEQLFRNY
ncbi:unnamed protein product [Diabrotica balteata]|uniref:Anticodon-binding domain-containing protein n=1 Tax=Diabrotica balteata TaxID=107213 RepID=A0A9N9XK25_DIABA|nr:unnamed protein product [Diabrotica balteata]